MLLASTPVAGEAVNLQAAREYLDQWGCLADSNVRALLENAERAAPQASEAVRDAIKTCGSKIIKALAVIARADGPDTRKANDPELIYREPVMDEVVRIRQAYDDLSAALSAQPSGNPGELSAQPGAQREP
ncbi:hypothetical protein D3C71_1471810 [compost metagenome]